MNYCKQFFCAILFIATATIANAQAKNMILYGNGNVCVEYIAGQDFYSGWVFAPGELRLLPEGEVVSLYQGKTTEHARFIRHADNSYYVLVKTDLTSNAADTLGYFNLEKRVIQPVNQLDKQDAMVEFNGSVINDSGRLYFESSEDTDPKILAFLYLYTPVIEFDIRKN